MAVIKSSSAVIRHNIRTVGIVTRTPIDSEEGKDGTVEAGRRQ